MDYVLFLVCFLGAAILFLWGGKTAKPQIQKQIRQPVITKNNQRRDELYGRLLSQVLGDRDKAGRLIKYARLNNPTLAEEDLIEIASRSLEDDIRRWD